MAGSSNWVLAAFDTTPDFTRQCKPQIVSNYDGNDIVLNAEKISQVISKIYYSTKEQKYSSNWNYTPRCR
jgi:hypothetical protein